MSRHTVQPRARGTSPQQQAEWRLRQRPLDPVTEQAHLLAYLDAIRAEPDLTGEAYNRLVRRLAHEGHPIYSKTQVRRGYLALVEAGVVSHDDDLLRRLRMKPTRTLSGVAPVTVLTRPHPCPGRCIFCPDDVRMPKSYLSNEPGSMRALMFDFDPYVQVEQRLIAMQRTGHPTDKIELLILGGTWSSYPHNYQEEFIRRCLDAMNGAESTCLEEAHHLNEEAPHRNVGLVVETRPDYITLDEVRRLRWLGVTRVQLGVQSLNDRILGINKRGHTVEAVRHAVRLLRGAGFKVALHWMPNLLGATPQSDLEDFRRFWDDPALRPDEMKLYPTGLIRGTELYQYYERGQYRPYTQDELISLLMACKALVPTYCRLNRVMRDIPAPDIAAGVTVSNLRQVVQDMLREAGTPCRCIRCREVGHELVNPSQARIDMLRYDTDHSQEVFLSAVTPEDRLMGFLRLSLPTAPAPLEEIDGQAVIRQVQVYGPVVPFDDTPRGRAQHQGLGTRLIAEAQAVARAAGFTRVAVIAAVGTRSYYRRLGFELGDLYMSAPL